jgi:hypothetical protein
MTKTTQLPKTDFKAIIKDESITHSHSSCLIHDIDKESKITFKNNKKYEFFGISEKERLVLCLLYDSPHSEVVKINQKLSEWIDRENRTAKYGSVTLPEHTLHHALDYYNQSYWSLLRFEAFWQEYYPNAVDQHFITCMKETLNVYFDHKPMCWIEQLDLWGNPLIESKN